MSVLNPISISTNGLAFFAFARHYSRNLGWFLFLRVLRCFSSPGSLPTTIWFTVGFMILHHEGFPIRKSTDRCLFTAPRGLSQLVTSFFGSWCQGIHLMLFVTWTYCSPICVEFRNIFLQIWLLVFYHPLVAKLQFLTFFLGKTNFYLFLLLSQYLFVCFIRFSMIICIHSTHLQSKFVEWSVWMDSNHRPRAYQARALTTWATDRGGDDGIRTHDPLLAGQVLSQLSYTPMGYMSFGSWSVPENWTTNLLFLLPNSHCPLGSLRIRTYTKYPWDISRSP